MFTVEWRDSVRDRILVMADDDERVTAGAVVGSLAIGGGDRWSDLDLTFAVADAFAVADVLDSWTQTLAAELGATSLVDLDSGPTRYRVFLLAGALQLDLSMTPATQFRPARPRFRLLFGEIAAAGAPSATKAAPRPLFIPTPGAPRELFGWGVVYALHGRACIERGRVWQAEHYVGAARDHALSMACIREGVAVAEARGYDDLATRTLDRLAGSHVGAAEPEALRAALAASVRALIEEGVEARLDNAAVVAERLAELT